MDQLTLCCSDTAYETCLTRAANALRLLSDKPIAKQITLLEQYLPRWITMLLQWCILHIMFWQAVIGDDNLWVCVCVCGSLQYVLLQASVVGTVHEWNFIWCIVCFVGLTDDHFVQLLFFWVNGPVCIDTYVYVLAYVCLPTKVHESSSFWETG